MEIEQFDLFNLVGGTSLALQIGHRKSIDIDLFGEQDILIDEYIDILNTIGNLKLLKTSSNILITSVNNIKVDFVNYKYPLLKNSIVKENIRMVTKEDIAAMKLNAIAGRGSKKDFIDLYFLLNYFTLTEMINFYNMKYKDGSIFMVMKSLVYFEDAEQEVTPEMLVDFDWENCKNRICEEVENYTS